GLFSIKISFSFSMKLKETFTINNLGTPPWTVASGQAAGTLRAGTATRLRAAREQLALVEPLAITEPDWSNLLPAQTPGALAAYLATAVAMARDEWQDPKNQDPKNQQPCYVGMLFIDSVPPVGSAAVVSAYMDTQAPTFVYVRFNTRMDAAAVAVSN